MPKSEVPMSYILNKTSKFRERNRIRNMIYITTDTRNIFFFKRNYARFLNPP